jgi:hypothetical protein
MATADAFTGRTASARDMAAAVRNCLQTKVSSASVLVAAALAALAWAKLPGGSYEIVWTTHLSVRLGGWGVTELATPVDPERDHVRGPEEAPVTLVEYGDYECPYCGRAEGTVRELLQAFSEELRYVFRHLPLVEVHPHAELAADAAEAAGAQGRFWQMHDLLFANQRALEPADLRDRAAQLGLDVERFWDEMRSRVHARRVTEDVRSAAESGVAGTPTFFINRRHHQGRLRLKTLTAAVRLARRRYSIGAAAERARQSGS